jgi:hypothetical protein
MVLSAVSISGPSANATILPELDHAGGSFRRRAASVNHPRTCCPDRQYGRTARPRSTGSKAAIAATGPTLPALVAEIAKFSWRTAHIWGTSHVRRTSIRLPPPHVARVAQVSGIMATSRIAAGSRSGEAPADAGLQLCVATRRKQELGGHPTGIVLRAAVFGARLGYGTFDRKGR